MPAPKKPQDHLKTKAERELELFEWEHDGETLTLPPASKVKAGVIRKASKAPTEVGQVFTVIEAIADGNALELIDDMEISELEEMFAAWQKHSGASLGES